MTGKVKFYKPDKGCGFITGEDGRDYFVHKGNCVDTIRENDPVIFEVARNMKASKDEAVGVEVQYDKM